MVTQTRHSITCYVRYPSGLLVISVLFPHVETRYSRLWVLTFVVLYCKIKCHPVTDHEVLEKE